MSMLLLATNALAQTTQPATQPAMEFEQFQLVFLRSGDNPPDLPKDQIMELQKQHMAHLMAMGKSGKMVVAGPFGDQDDKTFRGMCLYRVGSIDEARNLAEEDPAVKAGRMKVQVMTWYVQKGFMTFPKAPALEP
jgi:uncharacterized protein YciI